MKVYRANIWDYISRFPVCITTNSFVKGNGRCVMGRGNALQARNRFKDLDLRIGQDLKECGNRVFFYQDINLFTFPVKHYWYQEADLDIIARSCNQLLHFINLLDIEKVLLPFPGVGNGKLKPHNVMHVLDQEFADEKRVYIVVKP
jgi:hypothetical protein